MCVRVRGEREMRHGVTREHWLDGEANNTDSEYASK